MGQALGTWDVLVIFGIYLRIYLGYLRNLGYFVDRICKYLILCICNMKLQYISYCTVVYFTVCNELELPKTKHIILLCIPRQVMPGSFIGIKCIYFSMITAIGNLNEIWDLDQFGI